MLPYPRLIPGANFMHCIFVPSRDVGDERARDAAQIEASLISRVAIYIVDGLHLYSSLTLS